MYELLDEYYEELERKDNYTLIIYVITTLASTGSFLGSLWAIYSADIQSAIYWVLVAIFFHIGKVNAQH